MRSRTGLFILGVFALAVPSAWMMIAAPGAPAEFTVDGRIGVAAALLPDGRMLIVGGAGPAGPVSTAEILSNGSVTSAAAMSIARAKAGAITLADGRVLVTGGVTADGEILGSSEIYDLATNSWSAIPTSLIEARAGHTASLLPDGRVVLAGGETAGRISQSIELFDPSTGEFRFAGTLSMPRAGHAAAVLRDGRVLIAGGSFGGVAPSASTDIFDPATETISAGPELLTGRSGHSATTLLSGNVLIAGGTDGLTDLDSAEIVDAATGTINSTGPLRNARSGHSAYLLSNGEVLILGGDVKAAELYGFKTGTLSDASRNRPTNAAGIPEASKTLTAKTGGPTVFADTVTTAISTDKTKYSVGAPMTITGVGFTAGGTVNISVLRPDHNTDTLSATADGSGVFTAEYAPPSIPGRYKITATDGANSATTAVTEADAVGFDLSQCAQNDKKGNTPLGLGNCNWIGGSLGQGNSQLYEGIATEQQLIITDTGTGAHTLVVGIQATKQGVHAYDWLVSDATASGTILDSTKNSQQASDLAGITLNLNRCGDDLDNQAKADCAALVSGATSSNTTELVYPTILTSAMTIQQVRARRIRSTRTRRRSETAPFGSTLTAPSAARRP